MRRLRIDGFPAGAGYNAVMERFSWSLEHEWTNHQRFANLEETRLSVFRYIETSCNPIRLHETLNYRSPDTYEAEHAPAIAA
jgi:putative transposase